MAIKGLSEQRRYPRLGKIRLGVKVEYAPGKFRPEKTDYFVCPEVVQKVFGPQPKSLRIIMPLEYPQQFFRCYSQSRGLICRGDGVAAVRTVDAETGDLANRNTKTIVMQDVTCAGRECPDYKLKCKEVMNLQFVLPEVEGLGVWQLDTGSSNSIRNINSAIALFKGLCRDATYVPLLLTVEPLEVQNPDTGRLQTVYVLNLRTDAKLDDLIRVATSRAMPALAMPAPDVSRPDLIVPDFDAEQPPEDAEPDLFPDDVKSEGLPPAQVSRPSPTTTATPVKPTAATSKTEPAPKTKPAPKPPKPAPVLKPRDPATLRGKSNTEMLHICNVDFGLQPLQVYAILSPDKDRIVKSLNDLTETAEVCYTRVRDIVLAAANAAAQKTPAQ